MTKVLISTSSFGHAEPAPFALLRQHGVEWLLNPHGRTLTELEVAELLGDCEGLIAGVEPLTEKVLLGARQLRVVSRVGTGLDNVDLAAAQRLGIRVFNTPDAPAEAVAELTLAGILNLLRQIPAMNADLHASRWQKRIGQVLAGKTVGIIGLGRIGKRVVELLRPFGCKILANEVKPDHAWAAGYDVTLLPLGELLRSADIVSLHASDDQDRCLLGPDEVPLMKAGAYLINTARGALCDEAALYQALKNRALAGAYLDTFGQEPYTGPLAELSNVVLTPHIGAFAEETRTRMEMEAVENLLVGLAGKTRQ